MTFIKFDNSFFKKGISDTSNLSKKIKVMLFSKSLVSFLGKTLSKLLLSLIIFDLKIKDYENSFTH